MNPNVSLQNMCELQFVTKINQKEIWLQNVPDLKILFQSYFSNSVSPKIGLENE